MGNVYYVGANNIASILVATPQGHILIDTGTQKMAAVVFPSIVKLGFKPAEITGRPQNLLKGKLDALWANKRPSPLALQAGQWAKMIDDSEAGFKKRLAEANTPAR
jgi:hypothetical protein